MPFGLRLSFILGAFCLAGFSCTRATEEGKSKVSIQLPGAASRAESTVFGNLFPGVAGSGAAGQISDVEKSSEFLNLTPSSATGEFPVNCYAVIVTGPDPVFQSNYCGKKDEKNIIRRDLYFGNYVGLVPEANNIELEVDAGPGRRFIVLGLYALDKASCRDLQKSPERYNLSRPFIVGQSEVVDLKSGSKTTDVSISLSAPKSTDYFDDCVVSSDLLKYPLANTVAIENNAFPYTYRKAAAAPGEKTCEPVDVVLRAVGAGADADIGAKATVFDASRVVLQSAPDVAPLNYQVLKSFATNKACVDGNIAGGDSSFNLLRNDVKARRWIALTESTDSFHVQALMPDNQISPPATADMRNLFQPVSGDTLFIDAVYPRRIKSGDCVPVQVLVRNISGVPQSNAASFDMTSSNADFFDTLAHCQGGTTQTQEYGIAGTGGVSLWMRTPANLETQFIPVSVVNPNFGTDGIRTTQASVKIVTADDDTAVASLRFSGKDYAPNDESCIPFDINLVNGSGTSIPQPDNVDGYGVLQLMTGASSFAGVGLYTDNLCTQSLPLGGVTVETGSYGATLYMQAHNAVTTGTRDLQFRYDDGLGAPATGLFRCWITDYSY